MTDVKCILAVDPGLMTGACRYWFGAGIEPGFELPYLLFLDWTWKALEAHGPATIVVMEEFRINSGTAKKAPAPWSLEVIGAVRWMATYHGAQFVMQSAADAKTFVSNDKLKVAGAWFTNLEHARDAGRHLLLYLARVGWYDGTTIGPRVHGIVSS
ncbi:hypothetical protein UFOVP1519_26 [uncultured Caudovirales phage]|uniref:RuvC-like resolvase n=1 Tax=uncultured Caudovirales phage TaxID=2100421 RepID=A0A6J5S9C6_9CAUD|nr:hypothetical protein UFOVP1306_38 [uncultured Caudovirales phage]CAB4210326.1 hypothetical protein UFOVP1422_40 [uncultured Caudovirales phage]CAB5227278.1 hypothetical protein UFOVP1519_26 [uncultured Caudovirales phage]